MNYDLTGRRALVTGSSRGIGSAIARSLAAAGAQVVVHYSGNAAAAEDTARQIKQAGGSCEIVQANLCDPHSTDGLISRLGGVDILVLNASVQYNREWQDITVEEFYDQVNCNLLSSMLLMQQAVPFMQQQRWGRIITIGSVQEAKPHPKMLVYSATKAAQTAMAKSLALQLAVDGITINNIAPGVITTDRNKKGLSDPDYAKIVLDSIPLGRYGKPEDCAGAAVFLCSEQASYITGQSLYIDGGKCL